MLPEKRIGIPGIPDVELSRIKLEINPPLVPLDSENGEHYLRLANKIGFQRLMSKFVTQDTDTFCGIATTVMLLEAFEIPAPATGFHSKYHYYRQDNLFEVIPKGIVTEEQVKKNGMTLQQFSDLLGSFSKWIGLHVTTHHADNSSKQEFARLLAKVTTDKSSYMCVNYFRSKVNQEGKGHFSPIAAFEPWSKRVLVPDVASYKYEPVWIPEDMLWESMLEEDPDSGRSRGFVVVRRLPDTVSTS